MSQKKSVSLVVSQVEKLTENAVKISFEIPDNQKLTFDFFAGQYVSLETEIEGELLRRAYSICSVPNEKTLSVAVKQIPDGKFSTFANNDLQKGHIVNVFPPEGKFAYIWEIYPENLGLIAAGSGITPILSIIKTALQFTQCKILLIYGNKNKENTMFFSEIEQLKADFSDRFFVHYVFSQSHEKNELFGRITPEILNYLVKNKYKDTDFQRFYICGPQDMVLTSKEFLAQEFDPKKIHTELFVTQNITEKKYEGTTQITTILNGKEQTFEIRRELPILESLLQNNLDVSYSCRGGVCSSCLAVITEGNAEMTKNQILSEEEINKGYILTCQAHPVCETLTLNFDEI